MANNRFDERYPAMFQAGGDGPPKGAEVAPPTVVPQSQPGPTAPQPEPQPVSASGESRAGDAHGPREPNAHDGEAHATGDAWRWPIPLAAAVIMIAVGVFTLTAQYWLPPAMESDPSATHGIVLQPWGQMIYPAAPAFLGTGIGILGALLFGASRRNAAAEPWLRAALAFAAAALGVAGWVALFASTIFLEATYKFFGGYGNQSLMPWTYLLMPVGIWLLSVALLMLAALCVVPRRWRRGWSEDAGLSGDAEYFQDSGFSGGEALPVGGRASAGRAVLFGTVVAAAGMAALLAPYLFPLGTGDTTVEISPGIVVGQSGWATLAQSLASPLLLAGSVVLAGAFLLLAVRPGRAARAAQGGESAVVPWDQVH